MMLRNKTTPRLLLLLEKIYKLLTNKPKMSMTSLINLMLTPISWTTTSTKLKSTRIKKISLMMIPNIYSIITMSLIRN